MLTTKAFAKAGLDIVTSAMCRHRQSFQRDEYHSALVLIINILNFIEHWFRAGRSMNAATSSMHSRYGRFKPFNMKAIIWTNRMFLVIFFMLSILAVAGKIAFGHGMGDFLYCSLLWIVTIIFAVLLFTFRKNKSSKTQAIATIVFTCVLLFLFYSMTIGRGPEYSWNGNIFYAN